MKSMEQADRITIVHPRKIMVLGDKVNSSPFGNRPRIGESVETSVSLRPEHWFAFEFISKLSCASPVNKNKLG